MAKQHAVSTDKLNRKKHSTGGKNKHFFRDLKSEIKKVVWPTRAQVRNNTTIVVGFVLVVGTIIWVADTILSFVVKLIFKS